MIKKIAILCSIFLNLCIVRWEPVAIRMTWEAVGSQTFTFYTENSNVFAFFVCLLVAVCQVICLFTGRQLPRWVKTLKYIATCCLTMTFLTVVFVLGPYCADQGGVVFLLTESSMLYHHLLPDHDLSDRGVRAGALLCRPGRRGQKGHGSQSCLRGAFRWRWFPPCSMALWPSGPITSGSSPGLTRSCWSISRPPGRRCCGVRPSWP